MTAQAAAPDPAVIPATPMQESMWWLHHRSKIKSVYNITWRMSCDQPVDPVALTAAWQAVHDWHDALRSGLRQQNRSVSLVVGQSVTVEPEHVVIAEPGPAPAGRLLAQVAEELHERPFQLHRPPLSRLTLVTVADVTELVLTVHHAMLDGWGIQRLITDLSAAYSSALRGEPLTPVTSPVSFADYARRSEAALISGRWRAGVEYWLAELDGAASCTLAADRHRYTGTGGRGEILRLTLGAQAQEGVAATARLASATPFAVLLAAFHTVLALGGAGPDVAVGIAAANRLTQGDQALVGYVSNLCISRVRVTRDDTFTSVVERTRDGLWSMLAHQGVPYPLVFNALGEHARARLGDVPPVLVSGYGPIVSGLRLGDVALRLEASPNRAARSDLALGLFEIDGQHAVEVEYDADRYDRDTVRRLLRDADAVLAAAAARAGYRIGELAVATRSTAVELDHAATGSPFPESLEGGQAEGAGELNGEAAAAATARALRLWTRVLGSSPSDLNEDFFAVGGRSMKAIELTAVVEAESGREFDVESWLADPTPAQLARQLAAGLAGDAAAPPGAGAVAGAPSAAGAGRAQAAQAAACSGCDAGAAAMPESGATGHGPATLVELRAGPGPHLHLLPGAGAPADWYLDLLAAVPAGWRVSLSQEAGAMTTVTEMARRYRADLDAAGARPGVLAGWSIGGQAAHQMAADYHDQPPAVVLLDSPPPVGYDFTDDEMYEGFATLLLSALDARTDAPAPEVRTGGTQLGLRVLAAYLSAIGHPMPFGMLAQRWQAYRRHVRAMASHRAGQRIATRALLVAAELADADADRWMSLFQPAPRRLRIAADHFGLLRGQAAREIVAAIAALAEATVASA